ncbi:LANO_0D07976g1_1 [Lachancea nothofagi CBS 11611]|uniref:Phosphatidylethanolamine N-methyltransferase n=1 Tax=Lachancea nothofagi CBS 11611 TaxID=1266666 RepID=A0A1G4JIR0_9SACH|nr:LANO_0D07976g1_1 [Lachancea nothofagi CBS 11611]
MLKDRKSSTKSVKIEAMAPVAKEAKKGQAVARTRSSNVEFTPAKTHDMVRSLFDPTLKKSFLEVLISLAILSNVGLCFFLVSRFGAVFTKWVFLWQYVFWRLCYNVGIGVVLHYQSKYESLTKFAKQKALFSKKNQHWLARFCRFEIESKMPASYRLESYPEEFNIWLLFRQCVDLILMQDFTTYILFVCLSIPRTVLASRSVSVILGVVMILFNVWVKVDAHRVVKDYAWYWGDFFYFQDSKLVFDGVFNISPHPMYSIGYMGYYGLSLISGDYKVLLVSIAGHLLQFLFLKYCETPHIEKIYGSDTIESDNAQIDELLIKENRNYSKPLITKGFWFTNFDKLRLTDYFTMVSAVAIAAFTFLIRPSQRTLFFATLATKLSTSLLLSLILYKQSTSKWFTRLFLKNGYTQVHSFHQWQFIYNYSLTITYTLLMLQTFFQFKTLETRNYTQIIFGFLLCCLQKWCDDEILTAISEFGWFYGDFFLTNYINSRKLNSQGIYRYLSNPERFLGVAGCWGAALITDFSPYNMALAAVWTLTNIALVKLVEEPHVYKVYGASDRKSGVTTTLMGFKPIRRFSEIVDKMENKLVEHLTSGEPVFEEEGGVVSNETQWEKLLQKALQSATANLAPNCELRVGDGQSDTVIIPGPVEVHWQLPEKLHHDTDWVGIYKVLETGNDRRKTKVPSNGHWTGTTKGSFAYSGRPEDCVINFSKAGEVVSGSIKFDHQLMFFEEGIYEIRYHSQNTHKVLMISPPFMLSLPQIDCHSPDSMSEDLTKFLIACHAYDGGRYVPNKNNYLSEKTFKKIIKDATGVDLSAEFLRRINYDIKIISQRVQEIKTVLESLE